MARFSLFGYDKKEGLSLSTLNAFMFSCLAYHYILDSE